MADLDANDVSITINARRVIGTSGGRRRENDVTITWGNGTDTWPAAGIPLPTSANPHQDFGLPVSIELVDIIEHLVEPAYMYHYDRTNHKILAYGGATSAAGTFDARGSTAPASGTGVRCRVVGT